MSVLGLLDTGAAVNVLPFHVGLDLGLAWEQQTTSVQLSGNMAVAEARAVLVSAAVAGFAPVSLAFAWASVDTMPVILGQVNFFLQFDVCFFRTRQIFEIRAAQRT